MRPCFTKQTTSLIKDKWRVKGSLYFVRHGIPGNKQVKNQSLAEGEDMETLRSFLGVKVGPRLLLKAQWQKPGHKGAGQQQDRRWVWWGRRRSGPSVRATMNWAIDKICIEKGLKSLAQVDNIKANKELNDEVMVKASASVTVVFILIWQPSICYRTMAFFFNKIQIIFAILSYCEKLNNDIFILISKM